MQADLPSLSDVNAAKAARSTTVRYSVLALVVVLLGTSGAVQASGVPTRPYMPSPVSPYVPSPVKAIYPTPVVTKPVTPVIKPVIPVHPHPIHVLPVYPTYPVYPVYPSYPVYPVYPASTHGLPAYGLPAYGTYGPATPVIAPAYYKGLGF
jgi:hypothetical protein